MADLLDQLQPEHLDGDQRKLAEEIGIDAYKTLVKMYAGCVVYIPTVDKLTIKVRDSKIREEYTGYNYRELALKYSISEQWVRSIVGPAIPAVGGQVGMFDEPEAAGGG